MPFQRVSSSHQVVKALELQLQHHLRTFKRGDMEKLPEGN